MIECDFDIRVAAMTHCSRLMREHHGAVPWPSIQPGFDFSGERIYLGSTPRGIHRPTQMRRGVLSIKTTKPKGGRVARYNDQLRSDGYFSYAFQGENARSHDNTALRESQIDQTPLLYFSAIAPGLYQILFPCFVVTWDPVALQCSVAVGSSHELERLIPARIADTPERRYTTVEAKVRLHQAEFREIVLDAYGRRCAISGLPISELLEAAHIIPDRDERGCPEVTNGLCLSRLHHTAYDCNLIGIDPDGVVHVARQVLDQQDGPTLEAIKVAHGARIRTPGRADDHPRREFLEERFAAFRRSG